MWFDLVLFIFFTFALGSIIGSFLNVLVYRIYQGATIVGRSECPHCQVKLKPQHLVPIFSWLILKGRCADCNKKIHIQYPLVEAATGVLFAITASIHWSGIMQGSFSIFTLIRDLLFISVLILCVAFDLRWKLLPVEIMAGMGLIFAAWNVLTKTATLEQTVLAIAVGAGFLGLQYLLTKGRSLGGGDIWLGAMLGAMLGWPGIGVSLYLTYIVGGITLAVFLAFHVIKRTSRIPFAPLLAGGALLALWVGNWIQTSVLKLLA